MMAPTHSLAPTDALDRSQIIGASDVAGILGLDPYATRFKVYARKLGLIDREDSDDLAWGRRMEGPILDWYEDTTGKKVVRLFQTPQRHPSIPWATATPDGAVREEALNLEAKNVNAWQMKEWGEEETDQVPDHFLVQTTWQMAVTGYKHTDLAALFGGSRPKVYRIHYDQEFSDLLFTEAEKFYREHLVPQNPPPIDASDAAAKYLKKKFPRDVTELRPATAEEIEKARRYFGVVAQLDAVTEDADTVKNELKLAIGDAAGIAGDDFKITYKASKGSEKTDWESVARGLKSKVTEEEWAIVLGLATRTTLGSRRFLARMREQK